MTDETKIISAFGSIIILLVGAIYKIITQELEKNEKARTDLVEKMVAQYLDHEKRISRIEWEQGIGEKRLSKHSSVMGDLERRLAEYERRKNGE